MAGAGGFEPPNTGSKGPLGRLTQNQNRPKTPQKPGFFPTKGCSFELVLSHPGKSKCVKSASRAGSSPAGQFWPKSPVMSTPGPDRLLWTELTTAAAGRTQRPQVVTKTGSRFRWFGMGGSPSVQRGPENDGAKPHSHNSYTCGYQLGVAALVRAGQKPAARYADRHLEAGAE